MRQFVAQHLSEESSWSLARPRQEAGGFVRTDCRSDMRVEHKATEMGFGWRMSAALEKFLNSVGADRR